jgi:hypothetical protein
MFTIIAPSQSSEEMLNRSLDFAGVNSKAVAPFNIHRLLIADSVKNWQEYLASLETQLTDQV